jgi:hypothetical protein
MIAKSTTTPSDLTSTDVSARLDEAIKRLLDKDADLLKRDVNERSITHRLAIYVEDEFPTWCVDCEFNKNGHNRKEIADPRRLGLPETIETTDTDAVSVFPDIIVHGRTPESNVLAIEVKKSGRRADVKDYDEKKLTAYRNELGYDFTAFVVISTGDQFGTKPLVKIESSQRKEERR